MTPYWYELDFREIFFDEIGFDPNDKEDCEQMMNMDGLPDSVFPAKARMEI